jgi:hypothetical protein
MSSTVILYPIVIESREVNNPYDEFDFDPKITTNQTDKEWRKILREIRKICKDYKSLHKIDVYKISKFGDNFIKFTVVHQEKQEDIEHILSNIINQEQDRPSFYKNNFENNKYVDSFVPIFHPW